VGYHNFPYINIVYFYFYRYSLENEDTWEEKGNKKTDKEINGGQKWKLNQNNKKCMLILTWTTNNLCNFSFSPQLRNMNSIYPLTKLFKNWKKENGVLKLRWLNLFFLPKWLNVLSPLSYFIYIGMGTILMFLIDPTEIVKFVSPVKHDQQNLSRFY